MKPLTFWDRLGRAIRDQSFIIGAVLVSVFVVLAVLGPEIAPHNPFHRDRIQTIDGEMQSAPFSPSDLYPLGTDGEGRDMLSMLLHGARQTLVIAFVAMTARLLLGLLLGTISGWWPGGLFDRAVTAVTEFLAAIPALILAILLVFAIGVRHGQVTFIIALSLVGWGEIAQIVRSHVIVIRNRLFILASRAVGLGSGEILSRHVLPNLLATLLALAALEMGGVLLLQGELGFLHIFIGGGGMYSSDAVAMGQVIHYFEIPDWGAMLGTSWNHFRSLPWLPMAPALAFFVAILGFNLFGYGLQRFIEKGRFHPSGWSVLRFFAIVVVVLWGAQALLASSSLEAQFTEVAREFDLQRAWNDISYLTQPDLEGRPPGPGAGHTAASYIAQQFQDVGLTPLTNGTYFQSYTAHVPHLERSPRLKVSTESESLLFELGNGIAFDPLFPFTAGLNTDAELIVLGNAERQDFAENATQVILLLLDPTQYPPGQPGAFHWAAVLRMVPDDELQEGRHPAPRQAFYNQRGEPNLLIGESAARQLLEAAGLDLNELGSRLATGERITERANLEARLEVFLYYEETTAVNIVGYLPAADLQTQGDRVLVAATYTGPTPYGDSYYPGADEDASGVAVVLETARLWHEAGFEPKRTVVFAALDEVGGYHFAHFPIIPTNPEDDWTAVVLTGLGAGEDRLARLESGSGLAQSFDDSARRFGVRTEDLNRWRFFFEAERPRGSDEAPAGYWRDNPAYSGLVVSRPGDDLSGTTADTLDHLEPELLSEAGQAISHYLMVISSR